jgi:hypothetical protein
MMRSSIAYEFGYLRGPSIHVSAVSRVLETKKFLSSDEHLFWSTQSRRRKEATPSFSLVALLVHLG